MAESGEKCHLENGHISYSPSDMIGRGGLGVVYRGFMDVKNFEDQSVAIKKINLSCYIGKTRDKEPMVNLRHENFVKIVKVLTDDEFRYIVMEMCVGTLAQVIDGSYKGPNLPPDVSVFRDIAKGLHYIHSAKLMHLNIRPENILISRDTRIKISDFSFVCSMTRSNNCWLAPEIIEMLSIGRTRGTQSENKNGSWKVAPSSDIFSAGCVFFFFRTRGLRRVGGVHPFGSDYIEQSNNILKNRPINVEHYTFFHQETIRKMIAHNPRDRMPLPEVIKRLEDIESEKMIFYRQLKERFNLDPTDFHELHNCSVTEPIAKDSDDDLLQMNEGHLPLGNVEFGTPQSAEESAVDALVNRQTEIDKNYCLKDEPMDTGNLSCEIMNPTIPPAAPDESASLTVNSQVEIKSEVKTEIKSEIKSEVQDEFEEPLEEIECFKHTSFPEIKAKRVAFHPTIPNFLCYETFEGDIRLLKLAEGSFSLSSCLTKNTKELRDAKKYSMRWNINGTRLALGCKYGKVVIWEFPTNKIVFIKKYDFNDPRLEWNPYQPDRLAIYNYRRKSVAIIDAKLVVPLEIHFRTGIMVMAWISFNKFACGYMDGSLLMHDIREDGGKYSCTTLKTFENEKNNVKCLKWSPECNILASGSYDGFIKFWSLDGDKPIFTCSSDNGLRCHALDWLRVKATKKLPNQPTETTQQQWLLACGLANGVVLIFDPSNKRIHRTLLGHTGDIERLLFSPDGKYLMSLAQRVEEKTVIFGRELFIWSTETWTLHFARDTEKVDVDWDASSKQMAATCFSFQKNWKYRQTMKLDVFSVVEK